MTGTRGQVAHEGPRSAWTETRPDGTAHEKDVCEGKSRDRDSILPRREVNCLAITNQQSM